MIQDKVAIITGAGNGLGAACARLFGESGARITLADIDIASAEAVAAEIRSYGGTALAVKTDVRYRDQVAEMVRQTVSAYGTVHILVNNAGVERLTPFEEITEGEWDFIMDVNVKGPFFCSQAVLPYMKAQRYGKIVNVSSQAGRNATLAAGAHYTTSKAGLLGFTRHLARDAAPFGINVNAVCPGSIMTPMQLAVTNEEERRLKAELIPIGRISDPLEQARVILFLASDWAAYMCGAEVDVNGGSLLPRKFPKIQQQ